MRATVPILCPPRRHGRPSAGARLWAGAAVLLLCLGAAARAAEQTPPPPLTIEADRVEINDKTGVSTRLELALFAISHKLVDIDA